jgi:low affinity Fe/Cu permease
MNRTDHPVLMPSEVSQRVGPFDLFAGWSSRVASRAAFFTFCVLLVVVWGPSYFLLRDLDTWQLIINTVTTIITFLMVALLQNSQTRTDQAVQHKLNAIADGLADLMEHVAAGGERNLSQDLIELRTAVGIETHESTSHNGVSLGNAALRDESGRATSGAAGYPQRRTNV